MSWVSHVPFLSGSVQAVTGGAVDNLKQAGQTPHLVAPQTPPPSQALAATTSLQSTLSKEQNARSTATLLTAPGGLTDEPTTTGSLLTGV